MTTTATVVLSAVIGIYPGTVRPSTSAPATPQARTIEIASGYEDLRAVAVLAEIIVRQPVVGT
jgi:hypothetical protein